MKKVMIIKLLYTSLPNIRFLFDFEKWEGGGVRGGVVFSFVFSMNDMVK